MKRLGLTALLLVLAASASLSAPGTAPSPTARAEGEPRLYLTAHAPWGQPGAKSSLRLEGADSTRTDTLYLSFDPGKIAPEFIGLSASLYFWTQQGDTLGSFWHFERDGANSMSCRIEFEVHPHQAMSPFKTAGMGLPRYDRTPRYGKLSFMYAVPAGTGVQLEAGKVYSAARVLISHRRAHLAGYRQPICIEWGDAELGLTTELMAYGNPDRSSVVAWSPADTSRCEDLGETRGATTLPDSLRGWKVPRPR